VNPVGQIGAFAAQLVENKGIADLGWVIADGQGTIGAQSHDRMPMQLQADSKVTLDRFIPKHFMVGKTGQSRSPGIVSAQSHRFDTTHIDQGFITGLDFATIPGEFRIVPVAHKKMRVSSPWRLE
jgi:hypothetical protein